VSHVVDVPLSIVTLSSPVNMPSLDSGNVLLHIALADLINRAQAPSDPSPSPTTTTRNFPLACIHLTESMMTIGTFAGAIYVFRVQGPTPRSEGPVAELTESPTSSGTRIARQYQHLLAW
jgi:hypothetical protein